MATAFNKPLPTFKNMLNYTLYAPAVEEGAKQARLVFSFMDYRPRLTLFTNVSTDERKGIIGAGYHPEIFFSVLDEFEKILSAPAGTSIPIRNLTAVRTDEGKPTGEKVVQSQLVFGKDDAGIIYISLIAQGLTKIKFYFKMNEYHQIFKTDKTPITEEEGSIMMAKGWLHGIRKATEIHSSMFGPDSGQASNNKQSSSTVANAASASMLDFTDDDIPM